MTTANRRESAGESGAPSWSVPLYIGGVAGLAVVLGLLSWARLPLKHDGILPTAVLCLMGVLGSSSGERNVGDRISFNFSSIIELAAVAIVGPFGAMAVGATTYLFEPRRAWNVRFFNAAMTASISAMSGFAYLFAGGLEKVAETSKVNDLLVTVGLPLMVADVVLCLANAVILSGIVRLSQDIPMRRFIAGMLGTSGPAYMGYGIVGFLFVVLWGPARVGLFSAVLILAPLFVARWAFVQYGDEQRAHERTLSALVTAVEIKDHYTRGHSERVARLCTIMAGALGLGHQDNEALRYAGMLHDIGKLGIPTRVLRKTQELTDEDLAAVTLHPARGVEMIREIDFLRGSFDAIRHHHERFDGHGYPAGLAAQEIPLFARIIAVADAFDSLTTTRLHRDAYSVEEALAELTRRAGSQLDPVVVAALERGLLRHTWEPTRLEPGLLATAGSAFDHDDPAASDLLASRTELLRARRPSGLQRRAPR